MIAAVSFLIVMGVSGSGKTTIASRLASRLGWDFYDADTFHPPENITKMSRGIPLDDADRAPWLAALHALILSCISTSRPGILACSALKQKYRDQLTANAPGVQVVYLKGSYDLIWSRIAARAGHYMKPDMLQSQFTALEEPSGALVADIHPNPEEIVEQILTSLHLERQ